MKNQTMITENLNIFKLIKLLKRIEKFKQFTEDDIRLFLESGEIKEFRDNEVIFEDGVADYSVYFLLSGSLHVLKKNKVISTLQNTGDIFGEMGFINGQARSATIKAATNTVVLNVKKSTFKEKLENGDYQFCYTLYRIFSEILADRLRNTTNEKSKNLNE